MKYIIFFLITLPIYSKERIVVLDFLYSSNIPREIAVSSQNYFISELTKTNQFSIIEKSQVQEILKEVQFQQTGCTNTICEIQIGEMLSADKVVSGNIIKKNKKYIITVTIRNVKDKSLEFSETVDLFDLNAMEGAMASLIQKIPMPEDLNLAKKMEKLENVAEVYRASTWRTLIFPGWGHVYRNDWENGAKYFYSSLINLTLCSILSNPEFKLTHKIDREKTLKEYEYIYLREIRSSHLNNSLLPEYFYISWDTTKNEKNSLSYIHYGYTFSGTIIALTLLFALVDNQKFKKMKENEILSFSVKPESSLTMRQTEYYAQKGTHWELTYTIRF